MSQEIVSVTAEYREAERIARAKFHAGSGIDLPAMLTSAFVQGYAQALIDHKWASKSYERRKAR